MNPSSTLMDEVHSLQIKQRQCQSILTLIGLSSIGLTSFSLGLQTYGYLVNLSEDMKFSIESFSIVFWALNGV